MSVQKIEYENKSYINQNANIPNANKVTDNDMNEIKSVVNNNADDMTNELYYKANDTFTINNLFGGYYTAGVLTGGRKTLAWSIVVPKRLTNITDVTIDNITLTIRHISGSYIYNDAILSSLDGGLYTKISADNTITFVNERTNEVTSVSSNTPVIVNMSCTLTFS